MFALDTAELLGRRANAHPHPAGQRTLDGILEQVARAQQSGHALRARIGQELSELFADLPRGGATPPQVTTPDREPPRQAPLAGLGGVPPLRTRLRPSAGLAIVGVIAAVVVLGALFNSHSDHHISLGVPLPVLVVAIIIFCRNRR